MLEGMEYLCDYMTPELIDLIDIADYQKDYLEMLHGKAC